MVEEADGTVAESCDALAKPRAATQESVERKDSAAAEATAEYGTMSGAGRHVVVIVFGNLLTLLVVGVLYMVSQLLASYLVVILYAVLLSEALWPLKTFIVGASSGVLRDGIVGPVLVLVLCSLGAVFTVGFTALGFMDLLEALQAGRTAVMEVNVNSTSFEYFGVSRESLDSGMAAVNAHLADLEKQYNHTAWWPIVDDVVDWGRMHAEGRSQERAPLEILQNSTVLLERAKILATVVKHDYGNLGEYAMLGSQSLLYVPRFTGLLIGVLLSLTSSVTTSIFFVSITATLLAGKTNFLHELVGALFGFAVEEQLREVLGGVFFYPMALALCRWFYTLLASCLLGIPFPFLLTYLTFLLTGVPVLSAYPLVAALPWIGGLTAAGDITRACLLAASQQFVLQMMSSRLLTSSSKIVPSYATGLSVVLGFERFGIQAFVIGPLTLSLLAMLYTSSLRALPAVDEHLAAGSPRPRHKTAHNIKRLSHMVTSYFHDDKKPRSMTIT
eukprot:TRINITY_DN72180_c0_g1_i1.p1 TRINITY_DN72180_c0_g1~~TRINITY_DN72180_c0_g1_i1.p1  ORF type:complete len:502 (+),score=103.88 TRINITY_DN72180_c0_g1_i1:154-1659(+)